MKLGLTSDKGGPGDYVDAGELTGRLVLLRVFDKCLLFEKPQVSTTTTATAVTGVDNATAADIAGAASLATGIGTSQELKAKIILSLIKTRSIHSNMQERKELIIKFCRMMGWTRSQIRDASFLKHLLSRLFESLSINLKDEHEEIMEECLNSIVQC